MTAPIPAFNIGDAVEKTAGDYVFEGIVAGIIYKLSGVIRYVVEDSRGLLMIMNEKQISITHDK
jgi:hypothetical protein